MKIAFFDNLPDGGAKRVVYEEIRHFSKTHSVTYYTNTENSFFPFEKLPITIKRYPLLPKRYSGIFRPLQELSLLRICQIYLKIAQEIKSDGNQLTVVHPCLISQAPMLILFLKIPHVYYAHEPLRILSEPDLFPIETHSLFKKLYEKMRRNMLYWIDQTAVKHAQKILCNSIFTQKNISAFYKRNASVIHPGVDTDIFKPLKISKKHFLFIGDQTVMNGYDLLKPIMKNHPELPIKCITFKKNSFRSTDQDMAKLYNQSLATLCLSRKEPFGLAAIESSACGTPVLAVAEGGYTETVFNKKNGWLITRDVGTLQQHMIKNFHNPDHATSLQESSRKLVETKFSWKKHHDSLFNEIKKITI